jgi:hypothetical protein
MTSRGIAMGVYAAFFDLGLGLASPALGLIAGGTGLASVFLVSTWLVLSAAAIARRLLHVPAIFDNTIGLHGFQDRPARCVHTTMKQPPAMVSSVTS